MTDLTVHLEFVPDPVVIHYGERYQGPGTVKLWGYVCGYEDTERYGGPDRDGWLERIPRETFAEALHSESDTMLLWDFDGLPLARANNGSMTLSLDDTGLYVEATVDADAWNAVAKPTREAIRRGDLRGQLDLQWGFSFLDRDREWSTAPGHELEMTHRVITKLELRDIAIVVVHDEVTVDA